VTLRVPADHAEELRKNKPVNRIRLRFISLIYLTFAEKIHCNPIAKTFVNHFSYGGCKNPHDPARGCANSFAGMTPTKGFTHIFPSGNRAIQIVTNVGTDSGGEDYLSSKVMKE
jgi:hypothetical protein